MKSLFRPFPLPLSPRQKFYLYVLQGLGAGIIDGGANFGIAYAMYAKQDQVKMWIFSQNTIAGDLGVTPIIQCLASMLISSTLVHTDLHNHAVQPLAFCYPHVEHLPDPRELFSGRRRRGRNADEGLGAKASDVEKGVEAPRSDGSADSSPPTPSPLPDTHPRHRSGLAYYYLMLLRFIFEGTEQNMLLARGTGLSVRGWFGRLGWTAAQGAAIGVVFGFPLWCLAIVILGPIYRMDNMGGTWAPQIIKGVFGAVVGWVTNPVIAVLALGSQAEHHLLVVENKETEGDGDGARGEVGDAGEDAEDEEQMEELIIPTIHEGEELDAGTIPRRGSVTTPSLRALGSPRATHPVRTPSSPLQPASPSRTLSHARVRSGSTSSYHSSSSTSRPPLTANVSYLAPLPSPPPTATASAFAPHNASRRRSSSNTQTSALSLPAPAFTTLGGRQRGATVSHSHTAPSPVPSDCAPQTPGASTRTAERDPAQPSPLLPPSTPRSFSYALGGTGGRAQRPNRSRSGSVVSVSYAHAHAHGAAGRSVEPSVYALSPPPSAPVSARPSVVGIQGPGGPRGNEPAWDVFGRRASGAD